MPENSRSLHIPKVAKKATLSLNCTLSGTLILLHRIYFRIQISRHLGFKKVTQKWQILTETVDKIHVLNSEDRHFLFMSVASSLPFS